MKPNWLEYPDFVVIITVSESGYATNQYVKPSGSFIKGSRQTFLNLESLKDYLTGFEHSPLEEINHFLKGELSNKGKVDFSLFNH